MAKKIPKSQLKMQMAKIMEEMSEEEKHALKAIKKSKELSSTYSEDLSDEFFED